MRLLVTGGAGFIGSNFIRYILKKDPDCNVVNLDKLTYAGNLESLKDMEDNQNCRFVHGDITDAELVRGIMEEGIDVVINFAAESHVDRSIEDSFSFVGTNIQGTQVLLDAARKCWRSDNNLFIQISTDEVYGSLGPDGLFVESTDLSPNSPYSASKAGADMMARAYHETYGLPVIVTRCSNNYGFFQFPEKLIPLIITNALEKKELPVYGDGGNVRDWIHVEDHCRAIEILLRKGRPGSVYNIGGNNEWKNIDIVKLITEKMEKILKLESGELTSLIKFVKDRPGHDRRYAIDASKIKNEAGWEPVITFEDGIEKTIRWYINNRQWWTRIKQGEYMDYYDRNYLER
ncbi:MAG: dTDP-glucose 4,6-dehydratase [bacterium]|nr:MAG: dTDP-glucose 4,6-dehydratase [bacterium]